ncbi:MAG: hypothetical protein ABI140_06660 [Jatrophihabitantaceae bacterium]
MPTAAVQPVPVRSWLALALAGTLLLIAGALSIAPASASAATTYPTYSYLAGHRSGSAIYLNALIKQGSAAGVVRSSHRTVYVQRVINGSRQNMLSRVTSSTGQSVRLQLLRTGLADLLTGRRHLRILRLYRQLLQRGRLPGAVPGRHVQVASRTPAAGSAGSSAAG